MTRRPDLLLTFDFPPMGGGIARMMAELALATPPGEMIVSTGRCPGDAASDAAFLNPVDRLAVASGRLRTGPGLLRWAWRAESLVRQHQVGFVWCGNVRPAAYAARWVLARCGVPYGIIVYGGDLLELRRRFRAASFKRRTARWLLGGAAAIVAISGWTRDLVCEILEELRLDSHTERVRVIPPGTDPAVFRLGLDPVPLTARYGLPPGRWLVTVARLVPHKGIDTTIRALALLSARYPDLHYAVVGQGSHQASLKELAQSQGVADRVHFLTDVSDRMLPLAYALADLYVGVSRQTERDVEGFGIALLEAQASGKPVVAGRSGGMPDAVREGETGWLVDSEDPTDVVRAVASLLDNPAQAASFGSAGRLAVESYYNWPRVVSDLRALTAEAKSVQR
jgi:phosphatidylinositol alpha-1,6-mannosyltransferase